MTTRASRGGRRVQVAPSRNRRDDQPDECTQEAGGASTHSDTTSHGDNQVNTMSTITQEAQPVQIVSPGNLGTTKTGKQRVRRQWTEETNKLLMKCYYSETRGETDLTAYQNKVWESFKLRYPPWNDITKQNVASQIRALKTKTPEIILNTWRQEANSESTSIETEVATTIDTEIRVLNEYGNRNK
uniref:Uncharacterized protein n=1 Tax=Cacopsylla melanoneura TaxID=428564 RepID=A0A8D8Z596_9HEMI